METLERDSFTTGAVREPLKLRYDLIPSEALRRMAKTYADGAIKYTARNWEKGIPFSNYYNHIMEHLLQYQLGDRSEDHLAHAVFGLFAMMHHEEHCPEQDDWTVSGRNPSIIDMFDRMSKGIRRAFGLKPE